MAEQLTSLERALDIPEIHPDIARAQTLPGRLYADEAVYRLAQDRVFQRSWQFIDQAECLKVPGATAPRVLLEGCLDEPILFTRDYDDAVRCMSNVCTHRGALVCEHPGVERHLRCRYHGRRFGLDGGFQSMPEFEDAVGFPSAADDLPQVPFGIWRNFLFAGLSPCVSLEQWLAPMTERVDFLPLEDARFDAANSRDYLVQANWALYCDNYLEGFHIPYVHGGLADVLDYSSYRTELFEHCNLQVGIVKGAEDHFDLPKSSPDYGQEIGAYYFWLFPNLMFNFYPWGISVNVVRPLGPHRTKVSFLTYAWDPHKLAEGGGYSIDRVEREDEEVVESVQVGVKSSLYHRGRYSPQRETGVHHFHRLYCEALRSKN